MNEFVKHLKRRSMNDDKTLFLRWSNREIETEEAIRQFKKNNNMKDTIINSSEFIIWLSSLGYWRSYHEK